MSPEYQYHPTTGFVLFLALFPMLAFVFAIYGIPTVPNLASLVALLCLPVGGFALVLSIDNGWWDHD